MSVNTNRINDRGQLLRVIASHTLAMPAPTQIVFPDLHPDKVMLWFETVPDLYRWALLLNARCYDHQQQWADTIQTHYYTPNWRGWRVSLNHITTADTTAVAVVTEVVA